MLSAQGSLSGDLQLQSNFFVRDSAIGAANTPQYDRQKYGGQSWMTLNYRNWGFDLGLRFDGFLNSNIIDPQDSYSALGIGRWHIRKEIGKLDLTAGFIYDQIGNGTIFRAFEARALGIDNALVGSRLIYNINDNWKLKAFAGRQKRVEKQENLLETYKPIIVGGALDGFISAGEDWTIVPGFGVLRRTLDDGSMTNIVRDIATYVPEDRFVPKYTTYVGTVYNTLSWRDLSLYTEASYKTEEAVNTLRDDGVFESRPGYNLYASLNYAWEGLAATLQYKRTKHFILRTSPLQVLTQGQIAFLPPMARQNTYRLTARYNAATQEVGEQALQLDLQYQINKDLSVQANVANIAQPNGNLLYREYFIEFLYKYKRLWTLSGGFQHQFYNQDIFEFKPGVPPVRTYTPFTEFNYRFNRKTSLRVELSYMHNRQDFGSWAWVLVELNMAPHWSISAGDMINTLPTKYTRREHFYTFLVNYTEGSNLFSLGYIKQVEGVVCTGGICRYEPAFNGVRFQLNSRF